MTVGEFGQAGRLEMHSSCQLRVLRLQDLRLQPRPGVPFRMETCEVHQGMVFCKSSLLCRRSSWSVSDAIGTQLMHFILEVDMLVSGYKTYRRPASRSR